MTTTVYSNGTLIVPAWLNDVDAATYVKLANVTTISPAAATVLDDASVSAMRTTLGAAASGANTDITSLSSPAIAAATATTQAAATNNTTVATTAFVQQEVPASSTTVSGKVELATTAETQTGSDTVRAITPAGLKGALLFSKGFESAEQTLTINTATNIAHGFSSVPMIVYSFLRCKTTELGYAVGDEVLVSVSNGSNTGINVWANTTNVGFVVDDGITLITRSGVAYSSITLANWRFVARAWA